MTSLLLTAASPVVQAGLLAGAGALLARKGVLDSKGTSVLAGVCFYCFTPALTFSTLSASVSVDSIRHFWPLLANMGFSAIVGLGVGAAAAVVLHTPPQFRRMITTAIAFGNVGNLPLVFVNALCGSKDAVFHQTLGDRCEPLGIAYTAFDICVATLFQFTIALYLLKPPKAAGAVDVPRGPVLPRSSPGAHASSCGANDDGNQSTPGPRLQRAPTLSDLLRNGGPNSAASTPREFTPRSPGPHGDVELQPLQLTPATQHVSTLPNGNSSEGAWLLGSESKRKEKQSQGGEGGRWVFAVRTCMTNVDWAAMLPMATQAAIAGVIVGCVPPLRHLLHGPGAPLQIVSDAISLLGDGLVPAAIPLLGAVLYRGPGASRLPWHVTAGVVATRLLIQPALLTGVVVLFLRVRAFDVPDPMFLMTMLLANATPTAINLQMVTVLYGHGAEEMSQLLFWQYLSSLASLPLFIRLFLAIIDKYT